MTTEPTAPKAIDAAKPLVTENPRFETVTEWLRFAVVCELLALLAASLALARAVARVVAHPHVRLDGVVCWVKRPAVYRWYQRYRKEGFAGLRTARSDRVFECTALPRELLDFFKAEKTLDQYASVPELIRRAREAKIIPREQKIDRSTAYRACKRLALPMRRVPGKYECDSRAWSYPHRTMMILADGKWFRAGANKLKRLALFLLDDATRRAIAVVVGTAECTQLFLRGLRELILRVGLVDAAFLDRGPGFRSEDTFSACRALGINLILGTAGYPEGHGKIERFNQTAQAQVLRGLACAEVDPECAALEVRLQHYLDHQYNLAPHEALDLISPMARWDADTRPLRLPESMQEIDEKLVVTESRSVSKHNLVPVFGINYEVPRGHAETRIDVRRNLMSGDLFVLHEGRMVRLHPVDLAQNAIARRSPKGPPPPDCNESCPRTAAARAFERDLGPVVDPDGGFVPPNSNPEGDTP
jgi:putative transposase